jgi:hypothetical protein
LLYGAEKSPFTVYFGCVLGREPMLLYLFRDEADSDVFAFSTEVTGANIPLVTHIPNGSFSKHSTL